LRIKRDSSADIALNNLYRLTPMQTSFGVNMLALNGGRPESTNLLRHAAGVHPFPQQLLVVAAGGPSSSPNKARDRAHVLIGLALAVANIDEIIRIIRYPADPESRPRRTA